MRKRWLVVLAVLFCAAAGVAVAGIVVWEQHQPPGSITGSASVEFVPADAPGLIARPTEVVRETPWPIFKYDYARTNLASDFHHRPPYRVIWHRSSPQPRVLSAGASVLEFPPVIAYDRLYVANLSGRLVALDPDTGKVDWETKLGRCTAASPAVGDGVVYQPVMDRNPCDPHDASQGGFMVALDAETGKELWRFRAGVIESSPLLIDNILYFGSWDRKLYALDVRTHKPKWTFSAGGS